MKTVSREAVHAILFIAAAFALYARTISYPLVYDDYWRVTNNPGIRSLAQPARFLTDPTTQSGTPDMQRDGYRPLGTLLFAVEYSLWDDNAAGYRSVNILFHGANTALVSLLGRSMLGFSPPAAIAGALLFLLHPVQTESVIWVCTQSNAMVTFWFLLGLSLWSRYRRRGQARDGALTFVVFVLGLLSREVMVVFPAAVALIDWKEKRSVPWKPLAAFVGIAAGYFCLRTHVLGQMAQMAPYGGSVWLNLANVFQAWTRYPRIILWPHPLRVTYSDLPVAVSWWDLGVLAGAASLAVGLTGAWLLRRRHFAITFCVALIVLLWLPASNLFPLTMLFAERLVYPMMAPVGWLFAAGCDFLAQRRFSARLLSAASAVLFLALGTLTLLQSRVWASDLALWARQVRVAPQSWFAWSAFGDIRVRTANGPDLDRHLDQAERAYLKALKLDPPLESHGTLLMKLSIVNRMQGRMELSEERGREALRLRPDLKGM